MTAHRPTLMQRIQARLATRDDAGRERGLALLDVLLGMAIFALVVVIGVQNFRTMRDRAYTTQISADLDQSRNAIAGEMQKEGRRLNDAAIFGATPAAASAATSLNTLGVRFTSGITVQSAPTVSGDNYTLCLGRTGGPSIRYTSAAGSFVKFATANCT